MSFFTMTKTTVHPKQADLSATAQKLQIFTEILRCRQAASPEQAAVEAQKVFDKLCK